MKHLTRDFILNPKSRSIGLPFFTIGLLFGNWATFIPLVKERFALSDADLGLVLLGLPLGALSMNALGVFLVQKIGMQKTCLLGMATLCMAYMIPMNAPNVPILFFGLFLCGTAISVTNVSSNIIVAAIEARQGINIMSTCHGMFSIGLMLGSLSSGIVQGLHWHAGFYMISLGVFLLLLETRIVSVILKVRRRILPKTGTVKSKKFALPTGALLAMIIVGLCNNIAEGTMSDWTSVYMKEVVQVKPLYIGWGLAAYSLSMATGRFLGDALIPKWGRNNILTGGGVLSCIGILLAILAPFLWTSVVGFAIVGAGVSLAAPILYASAANVPDMAEGAGLAVMNTFAMGGFMIGPVIIGFVSDSFGLQVAFSGVVLLCIIWAAVAFRTRLY